MANTAVFNIQKPDVGADDNAWGDILNAALDKIDLELSKLRIPVNGLYLSTSSTNPATSLGYGTWAAYASGRALVGVGSNGETTWTGGQTKGSETHTLTEAQLPAHGHAFSGTTASGGSHTHSDTFAIATATLTGGVDLPRQNTSETEILSNASGIVSAGTGSTSNLNKLENGGSGADRVRININASHSHSITGSISSGGAHTHTFAGSTTNVGSGQPHNNVQPSIGVYVWRRTA